MDEILGMFTGMGETEDIPALINNFAQILAQIVEIIKNFLNGDFSAITGGTTNEEETTNA